MIKVKTLAIAGLLALSSFIYSSALAETKAEQIKNEQEAARHDVDNTGRNARDVNEYRKTADDQSLLDSKQTEILAQIRQKIVANDNLSINAKNIKIIVDKETVTLRGPVKNAEEKIWIGQAAEKIASNYHIANQLEVMPNS
jgi:hyperosmotically inducible protein